MSNEPVKRRAIEQIVEHGPACHWASNQISKAVTDSFPDYDRDIKALKDKLAAIIAPREVGGGVEAHLRSSIAEQAATIKQLEAVLAAGDDMSAHNESAWDVLVTDLKRAEATIKALKDDRDSWKRTCEEWEERDRKADQKIAELQKAIKAALKET